jgi:hypothetical protein
MKKLLLLLTSAAVVATAGAEDKVSAEISGAVTVTSESDSLPLVVLGEPLSTAGTYPITGKINVVTKDGQVHRVETYTEWSAPGDVWCRVWEKLYVSGGTFTGWSERLLVTPQYQTFSRNVIDGDIEQEIDESGEGFVEWTVTGANNSIDTDDDFEDDFDEDDFDDNGDIFDSDSDFDSGSDSGDLPTVEIMEEGEFDGISDRRIEIKMDGGSPTITFQDKGYERIVFDDSISDEEEVLISQDMNLEGEGDGSLEYQPEDHSGDGDDDGGTPTPTPTPDPNATPFPTPTPLPDDFSDDSVF